jgi:hypothetical protein
MVLRRRDLLDISPVLTEAAGAIVDVSASSDLSAILAEDIFPALWSVRFSKLTLLAMAMGQDESRL